jgi:hypothetical protein
MSTHLESGAVTRTVSDQASLGDIIELGLASGGTSWQQNDLTALTGAPQAASAPYAYVAPDGSGRVVYKASDGDIVELWLEPGSVTWQWDDLTAITGAPQASSGPVALVTPGNVARVIYQDSNDAITELFLAPGGTWQQESPTAITGALQASSAPFACVTPDNVTRVVYQDSGSGITELSLAPGGTWQHDSLTADAGADLPAESAPFAYVTPDGTARVFYLQYVFAVVGPGGEQAQDIIELSLAPGGTWQQNDLTSITGAPYPADSVTPFAYVGPDGLLRVLYMANSGDFENSGDIIELRLDTDPSGWVWSDLTISVTNPPAPPAASAPFGYVGADGQARVLYRSSNGDIIELRLDTDSWAWSDLTISVNSPPAPPAASGPFAYVTPDQVDRVYYSVAAVSPVPGPAKGLGSNSNYILASDCNSLINVSVTINVTEDIVWQSASGSTEGFSFQLNAYSPTAALSAWQQYVISLLGTQDSPGTELYGAINNYPLSGNYLILENYPLISLPSVTLPAGYVLQISLGNDNNGNVVSATYVVIDNLGNTQANITQDLLSISGVTSADLAPIIAFELNLVGPDGGESAVLSSGAGTITYEAASALTVLSQEPPCAESNYYTGETANSFYGTLPAVPSTTFTQSFEVSTTTPMIQAEGKLRPRLIIRRA